MRDLDVITVGSMMAEISPTRHSVRVTEAENLVIVQAGSATTFALACSKLGGRIGLISRVGDDEIGRWITDALDAGGVDTSEIRPVERQLTPVSLASVDERGRKTFAHYRFPGYSEPLATLSSDDVPDSSLSQARVFDVTESSLRSPDSRAVTIDLAERASDLGCLVCVNPNLRPAGWKGGSAEAAQVLENVLELADLAIMNAEEALLITRTHSIGDAARELSRHRLDLALVTCGADPTLVVTSDGVEQVPVSSVDVQYDIGAGDTFHAAFLAHWTPGSDPVESARFASQAAAIKIQRPPTIENLPTRSEVDAALRD